MLQHMTLRRVIGWGVTGPPNRYQKKLVILMQAFTVPLIQTFSVFELTPATIHPFNEQSQASSYCLLSFNSTDFFHLWLEKLMGFPLTSPNF